MCKLGVRVFLNSTSRVLYYVQGCQRRCQVLVPSAPLLIIDGEVFSMTPTLIGSFMIIDKSFSNQMFWLPFFSWENWTSVHSNHCLSYYTMEHLVRNKSIFQEEGTRWINYLQSSPWFLPNWPGHHMEGSIFHF